MPTGGNIFLGYSVSPNTVGGTAVRLNGWSGSIEGKFRPKVGIVAEFHAGYGSANNLFPNVTCTVPCPFHGNSLRRSTYLFGPRLSTGRRFVVFVHGLFGAAHVNARGVTDTSYAIGFGSGFDIRLVRGLTWRLQNDVVHTNFFGTGETDSPTSTGVVLRF